MQRKALKCEHEDCSWEGYMRTRCKNPSSSLYKKYLCPYHASMEKGAKQKSKQTLRTEKKRKETSLKRKVYFDHHIDLCSRSEESGLPIHNASRLNICHILPKSMYPSVGENLNNYVYLTGDEHTELDNYIFTKNWDKMLEKFPRVTPIIIERVRLILDDVTENHSLLKSLLEWIEEKNL